MWRTRRERDGRRRGDERRSGGARPRALLALALTALLAACGGPTNEGDLTPQATLMAEPGSVRVAVDGRCSLGEAILAAERNASVNECLHDGVPGPDTITLRPGGTYLADTVYDAPELLSDEDAALPPVSSEITVLGSGAELVQPRGVEFDDAGFVWVMPSGRLVVRDLTLRDSRGYNAALTNEGHAELHEVRMIGNRGGASVDSLGTLIASECLFRDNNVFAEIYSDGTLDVSDCILDGFRSMGDPIVIRGSARFERFLVRDIDIPGDGIFTVYGASSDLIIRDSTFLPPQLEGEPVNFRLVYSRGGPSVVLEQVTALGWGANDGDARTTIRHSTFVGVEDPDDLRPFLLPGGIADLHHTIVTGFPRACAAGVRIVASGWNLIDDRSCDLNGPGDLQGVDPRLESLADNGGPTPTMAFTATSPALDMGDPSHLRAGFDQRGAGFPRVQGPTIDIGAFEASVDTSGGGIDCGVGEVPIGSPGWIVGCLPQALVECLQAFCGEVPLVIEFFPEGPCVPCLVEIDLSAGWQGDGPARFSASLPLARADLLETAGLRLLDANGEVIAEGEMRDGVEEGVPHLLVSGEVTEPGVYWLALDGAVEGEEGFVVREALRLNMDPL